MRDSRPSLTMVSIIVPAYNEEAVIGRTLRCLVESTYRGAMEILVCCNGCTDRTVEIARSFAPAVKVIEISAASKTEALNAGDAAATSFPRIYLDADVELSETAVSCLVRALDGSGALAASPKMIVDLAGAGYGVRAFYDIWRSLPYHEHAMVGSGAYGLSREGRAHFDRFPALIADDGFVRSQFSRSERLSLTDCTHRVRVPKTLSGLIRIKSRSALGNMQLKRYLRGAVLPGGGSSRLRYLKAVIGLAFVPSNWPKLVIYSGIQLIARVRARFQLAHLERYEWERDETSRVPDRRD